MNTFDDKNTELEINATCEKTVVLEKESTENIFSIVEMIKNNPEKFKELTKEQKKFSLQIEDCYKQTLDSNKKILDLEEELENSKKDKRRIINNLLNILDQIDYVYEYLVQSGNNELKEHLDLTNEEIKKYAKEIGLEEIECVGKKFDPKYHKGEGIIEGSNIESEEITNIIKKGYLLDGEVFRCASVVIAK